MKYKKLRLIFILLSIICLLVGISFYSYYKELVPKNPAGTVGNIAGNLYNKGLFCEYEGKIYFSNPYDYNTLYVMNSNETEIQKISTLSASSINADGNFIYFYQGDSAEGSGLGFTVKTTGMYRMSKDGKDSLCLKREPVNMLTLIDNDIYYQRFLDKGGLNLELISTDKSTEAVALEGIVSPASVANGVIYYSNPDDKMTLYAYDTNSKFKYKVLDKRVYNPIYHTDGYLYFMDIDSTYELHRYHPVTQDMEVLTTDRLESYNIYGNYIYYQKFSTKEPMLMRMQTDGSNAEIVAYGNFENINITPDYVYYNEYGSPTPMYHQSLYGPVNPTAFYPN